MKRINFITLLLYGLTPCFATPNEPVVQKQSVEELRLTITETMKPVIVIALSKHESPMGCALTIGGACSGKNYNSIFEPENISTPMDVYCKAKEDCCNINKRQRNSEQYCECYANYIREKSYEWPTISNQVYGRMTLGRRADACDKYSDTYSKHEEWYNSFFYECQHEIFDVKFCDVLALTIEKLIAEELVRQEREKIKQKNYGTASELQLAFAGLHPVELYHSEYNAIVDSKEFQSLMTKNKNM